MNAIWSVLIFLLLETLLVCQGMPAEQKKEKGNDLLAVENGPASNSGYSISQPFNTAKSARLEPRVISGSQSLPQGQSYAYKASYGQVVEEPLTCPYPHGLFPHPYDCTKFLSCAYDRLHVMDCPKGLQFHPDLLNCVWPYQQFCSAEILLDLRQRKPNVGKAQQPPVTPKPKIPSDDYEDDRKGRFTQDVKPV